MLQSSINLSTTQLNLLRIILKHHIYVFITDFAPCIIIKPLIIYNYRQNNQHTFPLLKAYIHSAIMIVIMTLCELASMGIFSKFSYHFYSNMNDTVLLYSVSFLSKLLYFVIIYFISHKLSSTRSNIRFSIYEITTLAIIPVISVFVIYTMIYFLMNYEIKSPLNYLLILSSFFMLLINILIFGLFEHIKQKIPK